MTKCVCVLENAYADMVAFGFVTVGSHSSVENYLNEGVYNCHDFMKYYLTSNMESFVCNKLYRASLWQNIRFQELQFEDMRIMHLLINASSKCVSIKDCLYMYVQRSGTLSRTGGYSAEQIEAAEDILNYVVLHYADLSHYAYQLYMHNIAKQIRNIYMFSYHNEKKILMELRNKLLDVYTEVVKKYPNFSFSEAGENPYASLYTLAIDKPNEFKKKARFMGIKLSAKRVIKRILLLKPGNTG